MKPIACVALFGPHKSKAIVPNTPMKQPSNNPIRRQRTMNQTNELARVSNIVKIPIANKAVCCRMTRLTLGRSPILPNTKRPTPEVMPMQRIKTFPSASGKTSFT